MCVCFQANAHTDAHTSTHTLLMAALGVYLFIYFSLSALKVYSLRSMSVCLPGELLITDSASEAFFFEAELYNLADSL